MAQILTSFAYWLIFTLIYGIVLKAVRSTHGKKWTGAQMFTGFTSIDKTVLGTISIVVGLLLAALPLVANSGTPHQTVIYESYWSGEEIKEQDLAGHSWEVTWIDQTYDMRDGADRLVPVVELNRYKIGIGKTTFKYGGTTYSFQEFKDELEKGSFTN